MIVHIFELVCILLLSNVVEQLLNIGLILVTVVSQMVSDESSGFMENTNMSALVIVVSEDHFSQERKVPVEDLLCCKVFIFGLIELL